MCFVVAFVFQIHYILDNAGFELVTDFILLDFLMTTRIASRVKIFVKAMPWFVSDTLASDIDYVIDYLKKSEIATTSSLGNRCRAYLDDGQWQINTEIYWTLPFDYSSMIIKDPQLYDELRRSDLIVFKGDLNYRKLVGDRSWRPTTKFRESLTGFEPAPLVTLRTIKADTVTGLNEGIAEEISKKSPNWMISGEYGLVQFMNPFD